MTFMYLLAATVFALALNMPMRDDGLRHIAFAAHQDIMQSWGAVFPHSLFAKDYDPWFVWHAIIRLYLHLFSYETVHIAINATVLFVMMILIDRLLRRYLSFRFTKRDFSAILFAAVTTIVVITSARYFNLRPDLLSGLFLMTLLLIDHRPRVVLIISILYASSYYASFAYILPLVLVYVYTKEYRVSLMLFLGLVFGMLFQYYHGGASYLDTLSYLIHDHSLRGDLSVGEGQPLLYMLSVFDYETIIPAIMIFAGMILYRYRTFCLENKLVTLLLFMSPLWLMQNRFLGILAPIFAILILKEQRTILGLFISKKIIYWIYRGFRILKKVDSKKLYAIAASVYFMFVLSGGYTARDHMEIVQNRSYYKDENFSNKTILFNNLTTDIYTALYHNPTIKTVPSCSIGWFDTNATMKDIYTRMQQKKGISEEEIRRIVDYAGADYYVHHFTVSHQQSLSLRKMSHLGIVPVYIRSDSVIFSVKK